MRAPLCNAVFFASWALGVCVPAAAAAPPPPAAAPPTAEQVEALQQRLLASQQTIATLERQLADLKNRSVAMEQCRVKNGRLVFIGRELIEGYERRYREKNSKDPLQLGRRRFEFELQSLSDAVYDNRADVPVPVPGEPRRPDSAAPSTPPARGKDK
jgi:hypothetical protein